MMRANDPRLRVLLGRDNGACVWHGPSCGDDTLVPHHRANRGIGGHKAGDSLANIVMVCADVNYLMEADDRTAVEAKRRGIKLSRYADPEKAPIKHATWGWVMLNPDGSITMHDRKEESSG